MRTTDLLINGEFIKVKEGSNFYVNGVWEYAKDSIVTFKFREGIEVVTKVTYVDNTGTDFKVVKINAIDDFAEIEVAAEDIDDIEINTYSEYPKFTKKTFTKKELIEFIKENNIDIDLKSNMSKAAIVEALKEVGVL